MVGPIGVRPGLRLSVTRIYYFPSPPLCLFSFWGKVLFPSLLTTVVFLTTVGGLWLSPFLSKGRPLKSPSCRDHCGTKVWKPEVLTLSYLKNNKIQWFKYYWTMTPVVYTGGGRIPSTFIHCFSGTFPHLYSSLSFITSI